MEGWLWSKFMYFLFSLIKNKIHQVWQIVPFFWEKPYFGAKMWLKYCAALNLKIKWQKEKRKSKKYRIYTMKLPL